MTSTVYLHIGLQKTGTSYLQGVMAASRAALAEQGLDLVPARRREAFWLMLDVRDRLQPHDGPAAAQVLPSLARRLAETPGSRALVAEESLAPAEDLQIDRLLGALGDVEPHVIVTCRDLARQIPSVWQQGLKSGRRTSLPRYLQRLRATEGTLDSIWWQKDLPAVLARWGRHVSAGSIHVVPVPPPDADQAVLLERYCAVLGVDPSTLDRAGAGPGNPSLRLAPAEVLRLVNRGVPQHLKRRDAFGHVGKRYLSVAILGGLDGEQIRVPAEYAGWCREVSRGYVEFVKGAGYDVVGDLEDLIPDEAAFVEGGQQVSDAELAEVALRALTEVVKHQLAAEIERRDAPPAPEPPARSRWGRRLRG